VLRLLFLVEHTVPDHNEGAARRTQVLLRASVDYIIGAPVDWLGGDVGAHVTDQKLICRLQVKGEVLKFKSMHGLVVAIVEKLVLGASLDVPLARIVDVPEIVLLGVDNLVCFTVLMAVNDATL
jgi:hypothetical protein